MILMVFWTCFDDFCFSRSPNPIHDQCIRYGRNKSKFYFSFVCLRKWIKGVLSMFWRFLFFEVCKTDTWLHVFFNLPRCTIPQLRALDPVYMTSREACLIPQKFHFFSKQGGVPSVDVRLSVRPSVRHEILCTGYRPLGSVQSAWNFFHSIELG